MRVLRFPRSFSLTRERGDLDRSLASGGLASYGSACLLLASILVRRGVGEDAECSYFDSNVTRVCVCVCVSYLPARKSRLIFGHEQRFIVFFTQFHLKDFSTSFRSPLSFSTEYYHTISRLEFE